MAKWTSKIKADKRQIRSPSKHLVDHHQKLNIDIAQKYAMGAARSAMVADRAAPRHRAMCPIHEPSNPIAWARRPDSLGKAPR